jgi:two-component system chemotaxis response regulator CheY
METILIVDDISICRQFVKTALELVGYKTLGAGDGVAALEVLEVSAVNLVVLDAEMPRLDGAGFLRALRHDSRFLHLPVILLTGRTERDLIVEARMLGAQDCLLKPNLNTDELIVRVKRHLGLSHYVPPACQIQNAADGIRGN